MLSILVKNMALGKILQRACHPIALDQKTQVQAELQAFRSPDP